MEEKLIQATNEHGQTDNQSCSRCAYTIRERKLNLESIIDFAGSTLVHEDSITCRYRRKTAQEIKEYLNERAQEVFNTKAAQLNGPEQLLEFEKS